MKWIETVDRENYFSSARETLKFYYTNMLLTNNNIGHQNDVGIIKTVRILFLSQIKSK